jgi:predicted nucleic acid-binding protein
MIVLDASAAVEVLLGLKRAAPRLRERMARAGETLHVPELFDLEVLATIRRHLLRGALTSARADESIALLAELRAFRYRHRPLRTRIWELRHNLTPYDAAYVALAEALAAPLVTVDAALRGVPGVRAHVDVYP